MVTKPKPEVMKQKIWAYTKAVFRLAQFIFLLLLIIAFMASTIANLLDPTSQEAPVMTIFALMFATGIMEVGVRRFWPDLYYRIGIPVVSRNYSIDFVEYMPTNFANISGTVKAEGILPQVVIKQLSKFEYGLWANETAGNRGRLRRRSRYNPLTRGYICLDRENMRLKMRAYLNWTTIPFLFIWFGFAIFAPGLILKMVFTILGIVISGQLFRGEVQQYLKAWDAVRRYVYGEIEVEDIAVELAKTNKYFV